MKTFIFALFIVFFVSDTEPHTLSISFSNLDKKYIGKEVYIGFWGANEANFPEGNNVKLNDKLTITDLDFKITKDIEENTYAISLFVDMNGNGELDKNFFGIPKEPYCFSKNFKPKFSAPDFEDCSILIDKDTTINLELID